MVSREARGRHKAPTRAPRPCADRVRNGDRCQKFAVRGDLRCYVHGGRTPDLPERELAQREHQLVAAFVAEMMPALQRLTPADVSGSLARAAHRLEEGPTVDLDALPGHGRDVKFARK